MKKIRCILLANIMLLFSMGCQMINITSLFDNEHICSFTMEKLEEEYLKSEANCLLATEYYYACKC